MEHVEPLVFRPDTLNPDHRSAVYAGFSPARDRVTHALRAGEVMRVAVNAGDTVIVTNDEGASTVHVSAMTEDGRLAPGIVGMASAEFCVSSFPACDNRPMAAWLDARNLTLDDVRATALFGAETAPGSSVALNTSGAGVLWFGFPVTRDAILAGGAGGHVSVDVWRTQTNTMPLPDPLGDVREEFRIPRASAKSYQVREGEFIQIIDVEGRQCSDFMAMRTDALDDGIERYIDSTVTRTMVRGAYPQPGLTDKFFDQDIRPLLMVVQDTVGRHDTFGLACTRRGYEERGFLGHVNCSDNISEAFQPYGIQRRDAWPAINFFFNAWIMPTDNQLASDEAWSRPGDYVVMRAMTDLVCVSTACPDDVDPINGWDPTEVHVRIYKPQNTITRAVAYRPSPRSEAILTQESAFHPRTSQLTKSFAVARDVWLPTSYESTRTLEEYWACREAVTIQDMSALRKFDIMGPDAEALVEHALTRNISKLAHNRCTYALMLDETGAVIDDGTIYRMSPGVFRWCCGSDESGRHLRQLAEAKGYKVWVKSLFSSLASLAVQGPNSRDLIRDITFVQPTQPDVDALKWFGWTVGRIGDREGAPFVLSRTGFTGELGYEIFCDREQALDIWDALMTAGAAHGVTPMGGDALETIRIEAGLMSAGAEFGPEVDALEAGLGFAVDMKKEAFVGRDAIARNQEAPRRQLVGLLFDGDEHAAHGDGVFVGERRIGTVTSATWSPSLNRAIAMARIASEFSAPDSMIEVGRLDGHMKRLGATVTTVPFVDPTRSRARA